MNKTEEQKCRDAFEAWAKIGFYDWQLSRDESGNYRDKEARKIWFGWRSCWEQIGGPEKAVKEVRFLGIDGWNRPVFQASDSEFYGATDILFDDYATEAEVLSKVSEKDLTYFGSRFGCEPMGSPSGNIKIVKAERG